MRKQLDVSKAWLPTQLSHINKATELVITLCTPRGCLGYEAVWN